MNAPADNFATERDGMVRYQLQARGVTDPRVLAAMRRVPRERFLPEDMRGCAYDDCALPIACHQTISQPLIVGMMTQALELSGVEHVLEVGTGSGYQAAVLCELAGDVVSIERHAELSRQARQVLDQLGYQQATLVVGDGTQGWVALAPYDRIIVTAAADNCPPPLLDQLADGGILVAPIGPDDNQTLYQIRRQGDQFDWTPLTECRFVPLIADRPA